jgi:hypothetical protein
MRESTSEKHALIVGVFAQMAHPRLTPTGSSLSSTLVITEGWCSPALPTNVYGPLKSVRPQDLRFPTVVFARTDDRHSPVSRLVTQGVFH